MKISGLFHTTKGHLVPIIALVFFLFSSCEKPEGYGGAGGISGKITTKYYNDDFSLLIRQEPAVDRDVFLLFGNNEFPGDKITTGATGAFEFQYLRDGSYTLYYMSEDSASVTGEDVVVKQTVTVENGEMTDLGELFRFKTLDFNDGTGTISGVVRLVNYKNSSQYPFLEVKDTTFAQEKEVYLIYGDHPYYDDRIRTGYDGYFEFQDLIPGDYTIYVYSEDVINGGTADIPQFRYPKISEEGQQVSVGEILIKKL